MAKIEVDGKEAEEAGRQRARLSSRVWGGAAKVRARVSQKKEEVEKMRWTRRGRI